MAKAQSHILTSPRGSVGGLTYSANQFAQIVLRTRTSPVQPNTNAQTLIRQAMNAASMAWKGLTDLQRTAWENYALTVQYSGPHGTYNLPGRQIFISTYSLAYYLNSIGATPISVSDLPPTIPGKFSVGEILAEPGPNPGIGFGISILGNDTEVGMALIDVSPPQNLTRMRYKGPWDPSKTTFLNLPIGVSTIKTFDNLVTDRAYFVRIRVVTSVTPHRITSVTYLRVISDTLP